MREDTLTPDSLAVRPLPKWLTDQRDGLNAYQPAKLEMKQDRSLQISLICTGVTIIITIVILTVYITRRKRNN